MVKEHIFLTCVLTAVPNSPVSRALHSTSTFGKIELLPGSDDVTCR